MKRALLLVALVFCWSNSFAQEPLLVEGARQAIAYWQSLFLRCGNNQAEAGPWYAGSNGIIQMVPELRIQFKTEELSQEQRLNGFEFKATTSLESGPSRFWDARKRSWQDWQVGEIAPPRILIKRKGVWSQETPPDRWEDRKALATCSEVPSIEGKR